MSIAKIIGAACAASLFLVAGAAFGAGAYPTKPIRLVVPFPPAGSSDNIARLFAPRFASELHQQVIVDNRPGAGTSIGATIVAKAEPDGYTLLLTSISVVGVVPYVLKVAYDPVRDFTPIAMFGETYAVLAVHPTVPAKSMSELIALAKAKPGQLNYGSAGNGSMSHLWGELFKLQTGVNMVHVPFAGSGPSVLDLIAGRMQLNFDPNSIPHVEAGRLRGIAAIGARRCPTIPDVPTMAEAGLPDFKAGLWYALAAPRGLSQDIVVRLARIVNETMKDRQMVERLLRFGIETTPMSTAELAERISRDHESFGKLIRTIGLKADL